MSVQCCGAPYIQEILMDRGIPKVKRIGEIKTVNDLKEGERAYAESELIYCVQGINGKRLEGEVVLYIERPVEKEQIVAYTTTSNTYPITGKGAYVIHPYNKKFYKPRIEKKPRNPIGYIPKPH